MFGKDVRLFRLFGFEVKIDFSWLILAFIITWTLAHGVFPSLYEGQEVSTYWVMGIIGALGLFFSIVFHELCHSLAARSYGMEMKGITLFIFGGVAEMGEEPPNPRAEFFMAAAGPVSSLLLAGLFRAANVILQAAGAGGLASAVLSYLALINVILAAFNLVPAYPLDGGRILRAVLWKWKDDLKWATRIAADMGTGFGTVLIILGVLQLFAGNVIGGVWWFVIGMFLRNISQSSYRHVVLKKVLEGEKVERFMKRDPVTVPSSTPISDFIEDYVYSYHYKFFPVVEGGRHVGCITVGQVQQIPREEWGSHTVADISSACSPDNSISPGAEAVDALAMMNRQGTSRLMVVEGGELVGVITLKDLMGFFQLKLDMEGGA